MDTITIGVVPLSNTAGQSDRVTICDVHVFIASFEDRKHRIDRLDRLE